MEDPQKVLELTVQAGQLLLENGAEVFRVQQTMEIMAAAYGETEFHVYVLTNGIFASLGRDGRQHMARVGHVPQSSVHLGRVDAVNTLSRQIAAGQVPLEEAMARIEQIRAIPVLPLWQQVLACGAGTGFFAILLTEMGHQVTAADYTPAQLDAWADGRVDLAAWDSSFQAHTTLVAEWEGVIVGFADLADDGYLDRLYVHKDYQGQGIATALCDALPRARLTHASLTARPFFEGRGYVMVKAQQVERKGILLRNFVMEKRC